MNNAANTKLLPATVTIAMLVRDATGETLRPALALEVEAARASGRAWLPYTLLCPAGEIPCFIEFVTREMTDAEYNRQLAEIDGDSPRARCTRRSRRS